MFHQGSPLGKREIMMLVNTGEKINMNIEYWLLGDISKKGI